MKNKLVMCLIVVISIRIMEAFRRYEETRRARVEARRAEAETEKNQKQNKEKKLQQIADTQYMEVREFFEENSKKHAEEIERRSKEGSDHTSDVFKIRIQPPASIEELFECPYEKLYTRCDALESAVKHINRHGTYDARLVVDRTTDWDSCHASFRWSINDAVSLMKERFVGKIRRFLAEEFCDSHP